MDVRKTSGPAVTVLSVEDKSFGQGPEEHPRGRVTSKNVAEKRFQRVHFATSPICALNVILRPQGAHHDKSHLG